MALPSPIPLIIFFAAYGTLCSITKRLLQHTPSLIQLLCHSAILTLCSVIFVTARHFELQYQKRQHPLRLHAIHENGNTLVSSLRSRYFLIVLGSGGHTKEMLAMMENGFDAFAGLHRRYLVSSGDSMSLKHLNAFENAVTTSANGKRVDTFDYHIVPRARKIHQPLYTTPLTALWSIIQIFPILFARPAYLSQVRSRYPDIILTNGPATGFFVGLAAYLLKVFYIAPADSMQILYVESWARIKTLSLTGKLFYHTGICDLFLVQHLAVSKRYGNAPYATGLLFGTKSSAKSETRNGT